MRVLSNEKLKIELDKLPIHTTKNESISDNQHPFTIEECLDSGSSKILLDYEDVNKIINDNDLVVMSTAERNGENSMAETIKLTILDFEKNGLSIIEAEGILVSFRVSSNYSIMKFTEAVEIIEDKFYQTFIVKEPNIIFGVSCDDDLEDDYAEATVIVGYSKKEPLNYSNNNIN